MNTEKKQKIEKLLDASEAFRMVVNSVCRNPGLAITYLDASLKEAMGDVSAHGSDLSFNPVKNETAPATEK